MTTSLFAQYLSHRHGIFAGVSIAIKITDEAQAAPTPHDAVTILHQPERSLFVAGGDPRQSMGGCDALVQDLMEYLKLFPSCIRNPGIRTCTPQQLSQELRQNYVPIGNTDTHTVELLGTIATTTPPENPPRSILEATYGHAIWHNITSYRLHATTYTIILLTFYHDLAIQRHPALNIYRRPTNEHWRAAHQHIPVTIGQSPLSVQHIRNKWAAQCQPQGHTALAASGPPPAWTAVCP